MRVRVLRQGFYNGSRRRAGVEFEWPGLTLKDMPRWVQSVDAPKVIIKSDEAKALDAIRATAGPKRPGVVAVRDGQGMPLDLDAGKAMEEQALGESEAERNQREIDKLDKDELV